MVRLALLAAALLAPVPRDDMACLPLSQVSALLDADWRWAGQGTSISGAPVVLLRKEGGEWMVLLLFADKDLACVRGFGDGWVLPELPSRRPPERPPRRTPR